MRCISWFQDLTKDSAPSRCSCAASASISTPAAAIFSSVAAQSPQSLAIAPRTLPWSAKARRVFSGIVLIVSGAASIEHGTLMNEEDIALFKKTGAYYVPTLTTVTGSLERIAAHPDASSDRKRGVEGKRGA